MIKKLFKKGGMFSTSLFTGSHVFINIASGFVVQKIIAVYLGPSGLALISQFQNFTTSISAVARGGISKGIVKYISEFKNDKVESQKYHDSALQIVLFFSALVSIFLFFGHNLINSYLFPLNDYSIYIQYLSLFIFCFSLNEFLLSVLNGLGEIRKFTISGIIRNTLIFFLTGFLTIIYSLEGAFIALILGQAVSLLILLFFKYKILKFRFFSLFKELNLKRWKNLLSFSLVAIISAVIAPNVNILIRQHLIEVLDANAAGYWDALWKLAAGYISFFTMTLSVYYLPKLSGLKSDKSIKNEMRMGLLSILPIIFFILIIIYFFRIELISLLFSEAFIPAEVIIIPFLIGNFFKIYNLMFGHLILAKAKIKLFVITQVSLPVIFYVLVIYLVNELGLIGVSIAYLCRVLTLSIFYTIYYRKIIF